MKKITRIIRNWLDRILEGPGPAQTCSGAIRATLPILLLAATSMAATPEEYNVCAEYVCAQSNVVASAPTAFALQSVGANLTWAYWNVPSVPKPTLAQLDSVKVAALAWKLNKNADMDERLEAMTKALALVLLDEGNLTRRRLASFKVQVAAATTLADLKTRVAALPAMPDRTVEQLKAAVSEKYKALNP
jgi:hypothetical protein